MEMNPFTQCWVSESKKGEGSPPSLALALPPFHLQGGGAHPLRGAKQRGDLPNEGDRADP